MKPAAVILGLPMLLAAFVLAPPAVVRWSASAGSARTGHASGQTVIRVRATLAPGWHVYSLTQKPGGPKPLAFELQSAPGFSLGPAAGPAPQSAYDAEFGMQTETYSGSPEFTIPVVRRSGAASGAQNLHLVIRYQACSAKLCLPPLKETLTVRVSGAAAG